MTVVDELLLNRFNVVKRFVEEKDASFILSLRTNEKLGRFLSSTTNDVDLQEKWIKSYKTRENKGIEFYFVFENLNGHKYGLSRIYNIDEYSFEIGSWLFSSESPEGVSILADLATRDYAFSRFDFEYCRFEVRKLNRNVVNYHKRFNPQLVCEDEQNYYFKLNRNSYVLFREKLLKIYNNERK